MSIVADLHVHTNASDGLLTPNEVVVRAFRRNLCAVAITDHDTVDGIPEALEVSQKYSVEVIPGIELSAEYGDTEIHILGFFIDYDNSALNCMLRTLQKSRYLRAEKMVNKLQSLGFPIEYPSVLGHAGNAAPGRPHIARALVEEQYINNVAEAFEKLIGYKKPAYVERYKITPKQAIEAILAAGGVAAWAHPGLAGNDNFLNTFLGYGIQGLEVYHPDHDYSQQKHYMRLAQEYGLFICGGSDFHGTDFREERELGSRGVTGFELELIRNIGLKTNYFKYLE